MVVDEAAMLTAGVGAAVTFMVMAFDVASACVTQTNDEVITTAITSPLTSVAV